MTNDYYGLQEHIDALEEENDSLARELENLKEEKGIADYEKIIEDMEEELDCMEETISDLEYKIENLKRVREVYCAKILTLETIFDMACQTLVSVEAFPNEKEAKAYFLSKYLEN